MIGVGLLSAGLMAVLLVPLSPIVFTNRVSISYAEAGVAAVSLVAIAGSYVTSLYFLIPFSHVKAVVSSTFAGAVLGIPVIAAGTAASGALGAMIGVTFAELLVVGIQWRAATKIPHSLPPDTKTLGLLS